MILIDSMRSRPRRFSRDWKR